MLENNQLIKQQELKGEKLLEDLASKGFKQIGNHGHIEVYSDGKKDVYYNINTESIVCTTFVNNRD